MEKPSQNHFRKAQKLKRNKEISELFRYGKRWKRSVLSIYYKNNELHRSRCAIIVPREIGHAVARNKIKRKVKDSVRRFIIYKKPHCDFIIKITPQRSKKYNDIEIKDAVLTWFEEIKK